jgi:hypothetical protein
MPRVPVESASGLETSTPHTLRKPTVAASRAERRPTFTSAQAERSPQPGQLRFVLPGLPVPSRLGLRRSDPSRRPHPHRGAASPPSRLAHAVAPRSRHELCPAHRGCPRRRYAVPARRTRRASLAVSLATPALVAQGIERRFPKPCVAGSNPAGGTTQNVRRRLMLDVSPSVHG